MGLGSSVFVSKLRDDTAAQPKRWLYLLYDQLNLELNPWIQLARALEAPRMRVRCGLLWSLLETAW